MNLAPAETLLAWMRANGVVSARVGDVELVLVPQLQDWMQPAPPQFVDERSTADDPIETPPATDPEDDPDTFDGHDVPGYATADEGGDDL